MSLADQAKTQINTLINTNIIQRSNNFIALPNDTHRYRYNPSEELSKIVLKQFSLYYIQDMSKRLNTKTTIIPFKNIDIEKEDGYEFIKSLNRFRTWVVKEQFTSIQLRFTESQATQTNGSAVEFKIAVVVMNIKTQNITTKIYFSKTTTIYGGDEGVKLYLKTEIISSIYAYEYS